MDADAGPSPARHGTTQIAAKGMEGPLRARMTGHRNPESTQSTNMTSLFVTAVTSVLSALDSLDDGRDNDWLQASRMWDHRS